MGPVHVGVACVGVSPSLVCGNSGFYHIHQFVLFRCAPLVFCSVRLGYHEKFGFCSVCSGYHEKFYLLLFFHVIGTIAGAGVV